MNKCQIIITDTTNSKLFNSKNVKNIIYEILISDSHIPVNENNYLTQNIKFFELDTNCDKALIEKAMLKEHLFVNIISTSKNSYQSSNEFDGTDKKRTILRPLRSLMPRRLHRLLKHAFTSRNRNAIFLSVDDNCCQTDLVVDEQLREFENNDIQYTISSDQLIVVHPGQSYERKLQIWILSKLVTFDGNFPFFCLPTLSRLICPSHTGIVPLKLDPFENCESPSSSQYSQTVRQELDRNSSLNSYRIPVFIHANKMVDWAVIRRVLYDKFSCDSTFIGHYVSRASPIHQDVNFLLVSLVKYFKLSPQCDQLSFTTSQMATLVSDCLRSQSTVPEGKTFVLLIEDIDWITSSCLTNEACSWLPDKCAPNIQIVLTAANDSIQEKSLKCRLKPPTFIDLSCKDDGLLFSTQSDELCHCHHMWCLSKLRGFLNTISSSLENNLDCVELNKEIVKLLGIFMCSVMCVLSYSHIDYVMSFNDEAGSSSSGTIDYGGDEKDQWESSEKNLIHEEPPIFLNRSSSYLKSALKIVMDLKIIQKANFSDSDESGYSLVHPQLKQHLNELLKPLIDSRTLELIKCRLGAYLIYRSTNLHFELLFVPGLLQYLSVVKDSILKDWLLNWLVLSRLRDEFCVPVRLLSLWRALLGPDTDYKPMLNAYIATCHPDNRDSGNDCCRCSRTVNFPLESGEVRLDVILNQSSHDYSRAYWKHRCSILLELARLAMQVGQYTVAKEMARYLLKQLDFPDNGCGGGTGAISLSSSSMSRASLLASCLHLLFCTLDERLKTFEFVTEQTTPIFSRTVHYGARALLMQHEIVAKLQERCLQRKDTDIQPWGDSDNAINASRWMRRLCRAEIRLAHIMTHFVFSVDGVEQTVINRHFMPSEIRCVTHACMSRAHEIATRLKDRQLLLEIQMTFGVIQPRENFKEKIILYRTPLRQALCIYGQGHIFVSRLYINIGISYEEQKKYIKAFEYFTLWSHVTHELLGRQHCKSLRSCGVFKEPIFRATADFMKNLNGEQPSDLLEDELSDLINISAIDLDGSDISGLGITGVGLGIGGSVAGPTGASAPEPVSFENMFMMRTSSEHESDWEIHSSDDETPHYTSAFEEVIDKFKKRGSSTSAIAAAGKELLLSILSDNLIDPDDLSKEEIDCLLRSQDCLPGDSSSGSSAARLGAALGADSSAGEAARITQMFRDLHELAMWIPSTNQTPSDVSLSRRLLELQRELEGFLDM